MTILAPPPDSFTTTGSHISRSQAAVLFRVPFCGQRRVYRLKTVILAHRPSSTIWTPSASVPVRYYGLPLMPLSQVHQAFLSEFGAISLGLRLPFLTGCQCFAKFGIDSLQTVVTTYSPSQTVSTLTTSASFAYYG
jgi:predicted RNA-binding Zn-ribbon protein involved in translation (DUF1610 family)